MVVIWDKAACWLHMNNLWFIAEVHSLLNSCKLQEPVNGHVVQAVCVKMAKMYLRACVRETKGNI